MSDDKFTEQIEQTRRSFFEKWKAFDEFQIATESGLDPDTEGWILARNGFGDKQQFRSLLATRRRILDAGCGNGRVLRYLAKLALPTTNIVGLDLVAAEIAASNLLDYENVVVREHDLLQPLKEIGQFDFIYCQEVLHHTANPRLAFTNLREALSQDGLLTVYVYKRKGPVREFADNFIHNQISHLQIEDCSDLMESLANLGKALSELDIEVDIPAIDALGIPAGKHDVQRLIYNYFLKCYWNPALSLDENAMVNFDWYHPAISFKYSVEEIRRWFIEEELEITWECVDPYGITMHGRPFNN